MFSKRGNRTLVLIAFGLLVVWGITKWSKSKTGGNTLRSTVVEIDTAALVSFSIHPKQLKHAELRFERTPHGWSVSDSARSHGASREAVRDLLAGFVMLRTLRLAGTMEKDAVKYLLVDTAGSRITFRVAGGEPVTLRAGLEDMAESQEGVTYVNIDGEPGIHVIAGAVTRSLDRALNMWRDNLLIGGDPSSWTQLAFALSGGQGYAVRRDAPAPGAALGEGWLLHGQPTNAARMQQFLEALSKGRNSRFADDVRVEGLTPQYKLVIQDNSGGTTIVELFDTNGKLVLRNNHKPGDLFLLDRERDVSRFIRPAEYLLDVAPQVAQ